MFKGNLPLILTAWMALVGLLVVARNRRHTAGAGLVLSYVLGLWMNYWVASTLYVLPWYNNPSAAATIAGTEQSLYAMAAFVFGSLIIAPFLVNSGLLPRASGAFEFDPRLPKMFLAAGVLCYLSLTTPVGALPSITAILSSGQQFVVAGIALCWYQAWKAGDKRQTALWAAAALLPPFLTAVTRGFMASGVFATISIIMFLFSFARSRGKFVVVGVLLVILGLSVYQTYMRDRSELRKTVWGGEDSGRRWDRFVETATNFEWFDSRNIKQLDRINDRLNQSYLVGLSVFRLDETKDYANGETLIDALLAPIPRALWTTKTISAGSGNLVGRFTGLKFDNTSTSVGIGPVMELYINFGTTGIWIGFAILGVIITSVDILATERLANNDLAGFALYFVPGMALMQTSGQFVEVTAGVAGGLIGAFFVNKYLHKYQRQLQLAPVIFASGVQTIAFGPPPELADAQNPV